MTRLQLRAGDRLQNGAVSPSVTDLTAHVELRALCEVRWRRGTRFELLIPQRQLRSRTRTDVRFN